MCPVPALVSPVFKPAMRIISSITKGTTTTVTTTFANGYQTGLIVRLDIPLGFGMQQINGQFGPIVVTGSTTFVIPIDSTNYDDYSPSVVYPQSAQYGQVVPMAEVNQILTQAVQNVLPY
jgi:hypothetical protein